MSHPIDSLAILMYTEIFELNIFLTFRLKKLFNIAKYSDFLTKCAFSVLRYSLTYLILNRFCRFIYIYIYIYIYWDATAKLMSIKMLKSVFYNSLENRAHFGFFETFSYAQSYILYVCKLPMSQQNDVN